jgi:hypothetical protein
MAKQENNLTAAEASLLFVSARDYLDQATLKYGEAHLIEKLKLALVNKAAISDSKVLGEITLIVDWVAPRVEKLEDGWTLNEIKDKVAQTTTLTIAADYGK